MDYETDVKPILTSTIRNLLQPLAGALILKGAITAEQATQVETVGAGVIVWAVTYAWSIWQKRHQKAKVAEAAATGVVK